MTKLSSTANHGDLPPKIRHSIHDHILNLVSADDGVRFVCDGCKLHGAGARYECARARRGACALDLDLHIGCALAPALREIGGNEFLLLDKPPGRCPRRCDACGGATLGLLYHCASLDQDIHPCCARLPEAFDLVGLSFELRLGVGKHDASPRRCALCADKTKGRRRTSWFYRSVSVGSEAVFLHVACARDLSCESFSNVDCFIKASGDASHVYSSEEMVSAVKASALRALLLKGARGKTRSGALARCISVLGFLVRVIIGVIFGDPTAMIVAVGQQALFSGE